MAKQEKDLACIATTTVIIIIDFVTISFCHCSAFVVQARKGKGEGAQTTGKITQTNTQIVMEEG